MNQETIFFPFNPNDDVIMAHSWVTLDGARFCFLTLATCPHCRLAEGTGP